MRISIACHFSVEELTQAKNPTKKKSHCLPFSIARSLNGLGALCIGGFRVEKRVAAYSPTVI